MTANVLLAPYPQFVGKDGYPLNDGYVYIGEPNLSPQDNPKVAYWDEGMTIPAAQPIRLSGGYMMHNGTPGRIYTDGVCSMIVLDKRKVFVYQDQSVIDMNSLQSLIARDNLRLPNYEELRAYSGPATIVDLTDAGIAGRFYRRGSAAANGVTVFKDALNRSWERTYSGPVIATWSEAKGDGIADDTAAWVKLLDLNATEGIDGGGKTYKIASRITKTLDRAYIRNAKFTTNTSYTQDAGFTLTCPDVEIDAEFDGGRKTYKTGMEAWKVFTSYAGTDSIEPVTDPFFNVIALGSTSSIRVPRLTAKNVASEAAIRVRTYGNVFCGDLNFSNCANKTLHVYHTNDNGVTQGGSTFVASAVTKDCGILPQNFLVDGVAKTRSDNYAPQGAFNLIVSFGSFILKSAVVHNYGASGVTPDRNKLFQGGSISITHTDSDAWTNNPSGAFWDEACDVCNVDSLYVSVMDRDPRDYTSLDSSAVQIFKTNNQSINIGKMVITCNEVKSVVTRLIRVSLAGKNKVNVDNFSVRGKPRVHSIFCREMTSPAVSTTLNFGAGSIAEGDIYFDGVENISFDNVDAGASGLTYEGRSLNSFKFSASSISSITGSSNVGKFNIGQGSTVNGNVTVGGVFGSAVVSGVDRVEGYMQFNNGKTLSITGNGRILSYIKILDVNIFNVSANAEIRTSVSSPIVWVAPSAESNVLSGVVVDNNLTITTGTTGAGYVLVPSGLTGVIQQANNRQFNSPA